MKSLLSALLLATIFAGCNEKSNSSQSRQREPVTCGQTKSSSCLPLVHWTLQTNLRPLDFKVAVKINDLLILDECNGVHMSGVHVPEHRRSVLIDKFYYTNEDDRIHVEIESWDESCTVSTEFYNNTDTPIQIIREEGQQGRVVLDLDR